MALPLIVQLQDFGPRSSNILELQCWEVRGWAAGHSSLGALSRSATLRHVPVDWRQAQPRNSPATRRELVTGFGK